jgi:hypothetical protein
MDIPTVISYEGKLAAGTSFRNVHGGIFLLTKNGNFIILASP